MEVYVYYKARQISPDICVTDTITMDESRRVEVYSVDDKLEPQRVVALRDCESARRSAEYFSSLMGDISDEELKGAVRSVFDIVRAEGNGEVEFESQNLKPLLRGVGKSHLHGIDKRPEGSVVLSFFCRDISPDLLAMQVGGGGAVYMYRENGPDVVSVKRD